MSAHTLPEAHYIAHMSDEGLAVIEDHAEAILSDPATLRRTPHGQVPLPIRALAMNTTKAVGQERDRRSAIALRACEERRRAHEASMTDADKAKLDKAIHEAYYIGPPGHYTGD